MSVFNLTCDVDTNALLGAAATTLVANINLPDPTVNLVEVEIFHDITANPISRVSQLERDFFVSNFDGNGTNFVVSDINGSIGSTDEVFELETSANFNRFNIDTGLNSFALDFCVDPSLRTGDLITFEIKYSLEGAVCNLPDGDQAILASWFPLLNTDYDVLDISYSLPIGDQFDSDFRPQFQPPLNQVLEEGEEEKQPIFFVEDNKIITILVYKPEELGHGDGAFNPDVLLRLGNQFVEDAPDCFLTGDAIEPDGLEFADFAGILILCLCCCGGGLIVYCFAKFANDREVAQQSTRRNNGRFNFFPGNPDIVLRPNLQAEDNTVQAVIEEDDTQDLDVVVPITTININLENQRVPGQYTDV